MLDPLPVAVESETISRALSLDGIGHLLPVDPVGEFAAAYNRRSFTFRHGLRDHPLFSAEALTGLAERLSLKPDSAYWSNGEVAVGDGWEKGMSESRSLVETVRDIEGNSSLAIMRHAEQDPVHGPLLRALLAACVDHAGAALRADLVNGEAQILVASPGRITPYHFDRELNYLFQVRGDKTLQVFDHGGQPTVSDIELEQFFGGQPSAARYEWADEALANRVEFRAGEGVHIPCFAPHWVQNGDNVSVAISICFQLRSVARLGQICWLNRHLRKLGLRPSSPRSPTWLNAAKRWMASVLQPLYRRWHRLPPPHSHEVWTPD